MCTLDQRRVHERAALDDEAQHIELTVCLRKQSRRKVKLVDRLAEAPDRGVVRRLELQGQAAKASERQLVPNRLLSARVGQRVPLLQEQDLEYRKRR